MPIAFQLHLCTCENTALRNVRVSSGYDLNIASRVQVNPFVNAVEQPNV